MGIEHVKKHGPQGMTFDSGDSFNALDSHHRIKEGTVSLMDAIDYP
jgi:hypothetical protein